MSELHDLFARLIKMDEVRGPSAWIQWKGTNACMDTVCKCGASGHVDASHSYFYRCSSCGCLYAVGQTIRLYELNAEDAAKVERIGSSIVSDVDQEDQL